MRKYKPQKFGLNPEWVRNKTIFLSKIILCSLIAFSIFTNCKNYAEHKEQEKQEESIIKESINKEESIIAESKKYKEIAKAEEEAKKESMAKIEVERRRTNTLYENEVSKKVVPVGTYLRNSKTNKVGRVVGYYGLEVITNNDWNFNIDTNGIIPEEVTIIGYAEYTRTLKRQKEQEEKKKQFDNATQTQKKIEDEIKHQTEIIKEKFGNYNHFKLGTKYYRVIKIIGAEIVCLEHKKRDKKSNYERIEYSNKMIPVDYMTYEFEGAKTIWEK